MMNCSVQLNVRVEVGSRKGAGWYQLQRKPKGGIFSLKKNMCLPMSVAGVV